MAPTGIPAGITCCSAPPGSSIRASAANDTSHPAKAKKPIYGPTKPMQEPMMLVPISGISRPSLHIVSVPKKGSPGALLPFASSPRRSAKLNDRRRDTETR